jgi:hypothetical protein
MTNVINLKKYRENLDAMDAWFSVMAEDYEAKYHEPPEDDFEPESTNEPLDYTRVFIPKIVN